MLDVLQEDAQTLGTDVVVRKTAFVFVFVCLQVKLKLQRVGLIQWLHCIFVCVCEHIGLLYLHFVFVCC